MTATARPNSREQILDAALRLMSERGASNTSMRELARECGIGAAALYHYFDSKDALLAAVIEERRYGARLAEIPEIDRSLPATDRLRVVFATVWNGAIAEEAIWRLLLGEGLRGEALVYPVGQSLLDVFRSGLAEWLRIAIPEVEAPAAAADLIIGQMFAGFVRRIFDPSLALATIEHDAAAALTAVLL